MILLKERCLEQIKCVYEAGTNCFVFKLKGKTFSVANVKDGELEKIFKICKVKDGGSLPKSSRNRTYSQMVQDIRDNKISSNFIWSEKSSDLEEELIKLSRKGEK